MRYVILRDDDTNALTPIECLETLYRPFLERQLPVNLATIPRVRTDTFTPEGAVEGFLLGRQPATSLDVPLEANRELVSYLQSEPGFHLLQHGYCHSLFEFAIDEPDEARRRFEQGSQEFAAAGLPKPATFIAPYDRFSRVSLREAARRFSVISTGWFELRRLPVAWWPRYAFKKLRKNAHWRAGKTLLLSHSGCLLSYRRNYETMFQAVKECVESRRLTVLVTHWWEYFRDRQPDRTFIGVLHQTADWLACNPQLRVISFDHLARERIPLNC